MSPAPEHRLPDWESFYANYRKPGYVPGFEIASRLGGGMSGLVFKATRQSIGKDYAIKFLKVDDEHVRRAVLAELEQVQLFAQIDHPNLVSIEDRGEVDGIPYLVMSYAGDRTLQHLLPGDAASRPELLQMFLQACRGTAALHEKGLVHFDLKPANVFLKGGVARVGDYGLSKLVTHSRGSLSMGRGTPYYMAPEMLQRRGDHRSDIYSLGVLLYEVLTGEVPFKGDNEWEVLKQHEKAEIAFPPHIGERERAVVRRCMHKEPMLRFQSVHDLLAVLQSNAAAAPPRASAATVVVAEPRVAAPAVNVVVPPPLPRSASDVRRKKKGLASAPVATILFGVAALAFFMQRQSSVHGYSGRAQTRREVATAAPPIADWNTSAAAPAATARNLRDELRRLAAAVEAAARRRSATSLRALDDQRVALPPDIVLYRDELQDLVEAQVAPPTLLAQLEQLGYPVVLAAVGWLQQQDYTCQADCRAASRVLQLLQQITAVSGLAVPAPLADPDAATTRRFAAAADSWRRLVERFAASSDAYRVLLTTTGKVPETKKN